MKHTLYYIGVLAASLALTTSCENELERDVKLNITVERTEDVKVEGDVITVPQGSPINFIFDGDPDMITFYSGERGHKYEYRNRTEVSPDDILSSTLQFSLWYQYGTLTVNPNLFSVYISDNFPGMSKADFKADSVLVESHPWSYLVQPDQMPQAIVGSQAQATAYDVDLKDHFSSLFTLAFMYKPSANTATQPRVNVVGMQIVNKMKDGSTTTLSAGDFGLTPLNMKCNWNLSDQTTLTNNKAYGSVTNNTSGLWNLVSVASGSFFIHSSGANKPLKYGWLVSAPLKLNTTTPDTGTPIKAINYDLNSYAYSYAEPGEYTATFIAVNSNYKKETQTIKQVKIVVVPLD